MFRFSRLMLLLLVGALLCSPSVLAQEADELDLLTVLRPILLAADLPGDVLPPDAALLLRETAVQLGYVLPDTLPSDAPIYLEEEVRALCSLQYGSYFDWPLEARHRFDLLMVELGRLSRCINLLPEGDPLTQDEACALALSEVRDRYGAEDAPAAASVFYTHVSPDDPLGTWQFGFTMADGTTYTAHVLNGHVTHCKQEHSSALTREYEQLCEERGGFFTWTLQQKADFAALLPEKLARAAALGENVLPLNELTAITHYGFCLPTVEALPQSEAYARAAAAVQEEYALPDGWDASGEVYYSFFRQTDGTLVWRVIFWKTQQEAFPSGLIDMNALTGEVLRVGRNGQRQANFSPTWKDCNTKRMQEARFTVIKRAFCTQKPDGFASGRKYPVQRAGDKISISIHGQLTR